MQICKIIGRYASMRSLICLIPNCKAEGGILSLVFGGDRCSFGKGYRWCSLFVVDVDEGTDNSPSLPVAVGISCKISRRVSRKEERDLEETLISTS